jgi:hypothetical protein
VESLYFATRAFAAGSDPTIGLWTTGGAGKSLLPQNNSACAADGRYSWM